MCTEAGVETQSDNVNIKNEKWDGYEVSEGGDYIQFRETHIPKSDLTEYHTFKPI